MSIDQIMFLESTLVPVHFLNYVLNINLRSNLYVNNYRNNCRYCEPVILTALALRVKLHRIDHLIQELQKGPQKCTRVSKQ